MESSWGELLSSFIQMLWGWELLFVIAAVVLYVVGRYRMQRDRRRLEELLEKTRSELRSELQRELPQDRATPIARTAPPALYLRAVQLENIRCFPKLHIELEEKERIQLRTMIVGDNSLGKSTLLRSIAIGLCNEGDAVALMKATPGPFIREGEEKATIKLTLTDERLEDSLEISKTIQVGADGSEMLRQSTKPRDFPWSSVFVSAYGTQRTAAASSSFESYSPRLAVSSLFDVQAVLQNPEVVLLRQDPSLRSALERKVLNVMLLEAGDSRIEETSGGLKIRGPWGSSRFDVLSDGYRSTTQWLLDLFAWLILAGRLPAEQEPAGILLIDEIEQHLHPRWQRHIIQRLSRQLPRLQIVSTTHTPLVASGMADVESGGIVRLFQDQDGMPSTESIAPSRLRGKRADQILTEFFDLIASRNPGSSDDLNRYVELRSKSSLEPDEKEELATLTELFEPTLQFGESAFERKVEDAVNTALKNLLEREPEVEFSVEAKRQLRELFPRPGEKK